jgi:hypothetical protein
LVRCLAFVAVAIVGATPDCLEPAQRASRFGPALLDVAAVSRRDGRLRDRRARNSRTLRTFVRRPWFPWLEGRSTLAVAARAGAYGFLATRREFSTESTGRWGSFDGGPAPGRSGRNRDGRPGSSHARRRPRRPRRFRGKTPSPRPTVTAIPATQGLPTAGPPKRSPKQPKRPPPRKRGLGHRNQDPGPLWFTVNRRRRGASPAGRHTAERQRRTRRNEPPAPPAQEGPAPRARRGSVGEPGVPHASRAGLRPPGGTQPRGNGRRGRTSRRLRQPTKDQGRAQGEGPWGNQGFPHALFVFRWEVDLRDLLRLE